MPNEHRIQLEHSVYMQNSIISIHVARCSLKKYLNFHIFKITQAWQPECSCNKKKQQNYSGIKNVLNLLYICTVKYGRSYTFIHNT